MSFLLEVSFDNIDCKFSEQREKVDKDYYIALLFQAMEQVEDYLSLLETYNQAAEASNKLELQRLWFYFSELCTVFGAICNWAALNQPSCRIMPI
jgi:hypothetical protein